MSDNMKIGDYCRKMILEQKMTPQEIVDAALEKYPDSAVDQKHIAWYKWDLKRKGLLPEGFKMPSARKTKQAAPKKTVKRKKTTSRRKKAA